MASTMAPSFLEFGEDAIGLIVAYVLQQSDDEDPCVAHRAAARSLPCVCHGLLEHLQRTRPLLHLQAAVASVYLCASPLSFALTRAVPLQGCCHP